MPNSEDNVKLNKVELCSYISTEIPYIFTGLVAASQWHISGFISHDHDTGAYVSNHNSVAVVIYSHVSSE